MKKTLLLAALFIAGFSLMAQEPKSAKLTPKQILEQVSAANYQTRDNFRLVLDSIKFTSDWDNHTETYEYDWKGRNIITDTYSEWGNDRLISSYNDNELLATVEHHYADAGSNEWTHGATEIYTYDENNNLILFEYNALNLGQWGITDRYEYTYDEQNRLVSTITWWFNFFCEEPSLELSSKEEISYDDNIVTINSFFYDTEVSAWLSGGRIIYTYNEEGQLVEELQLGYDHDNNVFLNSGLNITEYNEDGSIAAINYNLWVDDNWWTSSNLEAEYNEQGQMVKVYSNDAYTTGTLQPYLYYEFEYDEKGNRTLSKDYYYNEEGVLTQSSFHECSFDTAEDSDKIMGCNNAFLNNLSGYFTNAADLDFNIYSKWDMFTSFEYEYNSSTIIQAFYSAASTIDENGLVSYSHIYGTEGKVVINNDTPVAISIYDLTGRQVAIRPITNTCEINLTPGIYVVKAGEAAIKVVVR